jgi:hypothetical protein
VVFRLKERIEPSPEEAAAAIQELKPRLLMEKRAMLYEGWTKGLLANAEVRIDPVILSYDEDALAARRNRRQR